MELSRWLDQEFQLTCKAVGPLHGIPISAKGVLTSSQSK